MFPQDAGVRQRVLHLVREKGNAAGCPKEKILSKKCKEDKKNKKHEGGHGESYLTTIPASGCGDGECWWVDTCHWVLHDGVLD